MGNRNVRRDAIRAGGAVMCDEYYDARMRAVWRALAEVDEEQQRDIETIDPIGTPIGLQPVEPARAKPKPLVR